MIDRVHVITRVFPSVKLTVASTHWYISMKILFDIKTMVFLVSQLIEDIGFSDDRLCPRNFL